MTPTNEHLKELTRTFPRNAGVSRCGLPWQSVLVGNEGQVMPCCHGSKPVGDLRHESFQAIWNGRVLREVRYCVTRGIVHPVCQSAQCPFQIRDEAFIVPDQPAPLPDGVERDFDETFYLEAHADVRQAVAIGHLHSGLEHFLRHGRSEGRAFRLRPQAKLQRLWETVTQTISRCSPWRSQKQGPVQALLAAQRGDLVVGHQPTEVALAVTNSCNLKCVMCPHGRGLVANKRHLSGVLVKRLRKVVRQATRVVLSGIGEPVLSPGFWTALGQLRREASQFSRAHSNGILITRDVAERLVRSGLKEMSVSLDAATDRTYRRIRGAELREALAGVRRLLEMRRQQRGSRLAIYINMTLMAENDHEAADFVRLGKRLGVDAVVFSQLFGFGDTPDWVVERDGWRFAYEEQMLSKNEARLEDAVQSAIAAGENEGIEVILLSGLGRYRESVRE
ncbi:radical SAM protein [Nibricoccus sp. IMCC34717]|uniref:radical SAM protein n=1 Tax=Nibricoccus sp. IMCC34717 TaxID=3034021 RepID=UPI00384F33D9